MSTHIFLLLDMTGSMSSKKEATIDACNEYIGGQQSNGLGDDTVFTLGVFNTNVGMERIVDGVPMDQAPRIEHEHYRPDGATPLYDAIGQAMDLLEPYEGQVLFIIQTDGEENSSQHVTRKDVLRRVAEKTAAGWQFIYLGCDIDAMGRGGDLGIAAGNTMSYDAATTGAAFRNLGDSTRTYRARGSTSSPSFFGAPRTGADDGGDDDGSDGPNSG